ncbi:AEC family transporter [Oscillatoria sp. FACHB-1407]|uniref:AEC family transporter n=1 Tax=Oscillatoria sp. FACHB-1407 TaxID=2692847 RepID=UPI0016835576|nr:AEC family transporter [Oscillatoria sp. FACHB-1407]MBD2463885.1 AEC family transporter [Oscillatoria sp. FACHB-1407]
MTDTLLQAYAPFLLWTGLGVLLLNVLPDSFPRFLGRSLYWVGVPLQIFTLARQTDLSSRIELAPFVTIATLLGGLLLSWLVLRALKPLTPSLASDSTSEEDQSLHPWQLPSRRGSFILSSMIGNTGFVGLAIAPTFVPDDYVGWIIFYSVTNNIVGTYGIGVFLASYYGRSKQTNHWLIQVRDVLTVPSLWAFMLGSLTRPVPLPTEVEATLHASLWVIVPSALLLMGMRLRQLKGWQSLRTAIVPAVLKVLLLPLLVGIVTTLMGLPVEPRLALVLMSGMPTAFAGLILAEEYELDRDLIASSIVVSTALLLLAIPLWLLLFHHV